jgi:hypothetical protein
VLLTEANRARPHGFYSLSELPLRSGGSQSGSKPDKRVQGGEPYKACTLRFEIFSGFFWSSKKVER